MTFYPKTPDEVADTQEEGLFGAIGELFYWMEALTEQSYEPTLTEDAIDMILGGVLG